MKITQRTLDRRLDNMPQPDAHATVAQRIRYLIALMRKTQAQFGQLIDMDPSNVSKLLSGRIPVTDRVLNLMVVNLGVSKEWLVNGTDVPFPRSQGHEPNTVELAADSQTLPALSGPGAPVYDIDVTAGCMELSSMFTDDRIIGYLNMPALGSVHPLVRVAGDSMAPRIRNGSYVQIRRVSLTSPIFWGSTYVVVMEDYRMIKVIRSHPDRDKVILHSHNPEYDDMEINRADIRALYMVETVFNYDVLS